MGLLHIVKDWVPLGSAVIALGAAAASWRSAIVSGINTRLAQENQKQQQELQKYQKLSALLDYRYSKENYNAKKALSNFFAAFNKEASSTSGLKFEDFFRKRSELTSGFNIDTHRNFFIVYFTKLFDLHRAGLVKDEEMNGFVNRSDLALLFNVVRPMEEVIAPSLLKLEAKDEPPSKPDALFAFYERLLSQGFIS